MLILGIDPGYARLGYGFIESRDGKYRSKGHGIIVTSKKESLSRRLEIIYSELSDLIKTHEPDEVAIEELFFAKNTKTAISV
ncbi:MAG: crossover junction endodeoxyribonuclease RuvC, partial [Spirochaetota bacterium]|nr:crossover junction endodeoxyribonuclease RuvC [Spirochaetota bacterium]